MKKSILLTSALFAVSISLPLRAANDVYTVTPVATANESAATYTQTVPSGHSAPNSTDAGNVLRITVVGAATSLTLDQNVTLGGIRTDINTPLTLAVGVGSLTMDATGMTLVAGSGGNIFGNIGNAFLATNSPAGLLTVNAPIVISNTNLDIGTGNGVNTGVTINGAITATTAQALTLYGNGTGSLILAGNIGASGSNITISNMGTSTSISQISGNLGSSVTTVSQNSATSTLNLSGTNTYAGGTTLGAGTLIGANNGATTVLQAFGTGALTLNAGTTLSLRANGSANNQTIVTGNGVTGNNVTVGGSMTIDAIRATGGTFSGLVMQFNTLSIGNYTLSTTGANSYGVQFAGATTLTGDATFNNISSNLTLGSIAGSGFGITKTGAGTLTVNGTGTYTGATAVNAGILAVNGAAGTLGATSGISVTGNGTLQIGDSTNGLANRLNTANSLTLGGTSGSGTLTVARGPGTANSQSLTALNIGLGSNIVGASGTTGTLPVLTFSGATPYVRSQGGIVNFNDANVTVTFTNAPSGAGNVGSGLLLGAVKQGSDFILAQAGSLTASTYTNDAWASGNKTTVTVNSNFTSTPSLTTAALRFNAGAFGVTLAGTNVIQSGGIVVGGSATSGTISGGSIQTGISGGDLWVYLNARPLTINSVIADNGTSGLTLGAATSAGGVLTLTGANTYAGRTAVNGGTLQIGNGGTTGDLGVGTAGVFVGTGATLAYNRTNAYTVNSVSGGGIVNSNNTTGTLTLNQVGSGLFLKGTGGVAGATLEFAGDGTGVTSLGDAAGAAVNYMGVASQNYKFTNGTINLLDNARGTLSNIEITGATVNVLNNPLSMSGVAGNFATPQTFTMSGGVLNANASSGISGFNGAGGASQAGFSNSKFVGNQTGGSIFVTGSVGRFDLGSTTGASGIVNSSVYNFSGGLISQTNSTLGMNIGADTGGFSSSVFNFSGGKLIENFGIFGSQGTSARQAFVWTGGTLATAGYNATNLTSVAGATYAGNVGTLTNGGGIMAPGDIGTAGKTAITGNYAVTSANASYAVDIGSATAATAFQNGLTAYDQITVSGTTSLNGRLDFNLINSYVPPSNNTTLFRIINGNTPATSAITGAFTNQVTATGGNSRVVGADGLTSFILGINNTAATATAGGLVGMGARTVNLGDYKTTNTYTGAGTAWDTANAGAWANFDAGATATPSTQASNSIAQFADGTASTGTVNVSLNSTRNIQGVQFASTATGGSARNYNITQAGSGAIILDNTSNNASAAIADSSVGGNSNTIQVPIALNSNLAVSVSNTGTNLGISGVISGTGKTLTKTGSGILALSGANTYTGATNVNGGILLVNGSVASSAVNVNSGGTLGGSGTISGAVVVNSGGTLSAGNSPGVLSAGSLDLNSGSNSLFEINGTTRGSQYDGVDIASAVDFNGTLTLSFGNVSNYANTDVFDLFNFSTTSTGDFTNLTSTGFYSGSWFKTGDIWELASGGQTLQFSELTGDMTFVIPEPSTYAMLASGLVALAFLRRRKRA